MQQYIYGNIDGTGYRYETSEPRHFTDAQNASKLAYLMNYPREKVPGDDYPCYWMITTDLDRPGETERLYLQVSGPDPFRDAVYMQGYVSEGSDGDLYGEPFLRLLRTRFMDGQSAVNPGVLTPVAPGELPVDESLTPEQIPPEMLRNILLSLLQGKNVVLRLPTVGKAAQLQARRLLLTIYGRLPYEQRRVIGFCTGVSLDKFNASGANLPLPAAVKLVLMDGDAVKDVSQIGSYSYQSAFDLGSSIPDIRRENKGAQLAHVPLLDFLSEGSDREVEEYFRFCRDFMGGEMDGNNLKIADYIMLLDFFSVGKKELSQEEIRLWAGNLASGKWSQQIKNKLYALMAGNIREEKLTACLFQAVENAQNLNFLGVLDKEEMAQVAAGTPMDKNAALTLRMAENLMPLYGPQARERISEALKQKLLELHHQRNPALVEEQPTAQTLQTLEKLQLPTGSPKGISLILQVNQELCQVLEEERKKVTLTYQLQKQRQQEFGMEQIGLWNFGSFADTGALDGLYSVLHSCYLSPELLAPNGPGSWNGAISQKITGLCASAVPDSLADCRDLLALLEHSCGIYTASGGSFTGEEKKRLDTARASWKRSLELADRRISSVGELLDLFRQIDREGLTPGLTLELKKNAAAQAVPRADDLCAAAPALCRQAGNPAELPLLAQVVAAVPDLAEVPAGADLEQTEKRLKALAHLAQAQLLEGDTRMRDWNVTAPAADLLQQVLSLKNWNRELKAPKLKNENIRSWAIRELAGNTPLMGLIARKYPASRSHVIRAVAQRANVTGKDARHLYVSGCSWSQLKQEDNPRWRAALEEIFPTALPVLPAPLAPTEPRKDNSGAFALIQTILLGLTVLAVPVVMLIFGASLVLWIVAAASLAVFAGALAVAGLVSRGKAKKPLLGLAAAGVPGVLLSLVMMIVTLL